MELSESDRKHTYMSGGLTVLLIHGSRVQQALVSHRGAAMLLKGTFKVQQMPHLRPCKRTSGPYRVSLTTLAPWVKEAVLCCPVECVTG